MKTETIFSRLNILLYIKNEINSYFFDVKYQRLKFIDQHNKTIIHRQQHHNPISTHKINLKNV